ncbi:hypothetical protein SDJN03_18634, partial [Cucurbita argyrosperma subsp. sororia]
MNKWIDCSEPARCTLFEGSNSGLSYSFPSSWLEYGSFLGPLNNLLKKNRHHGIGLEKIKRPLRTYKVKGASWLIRCWPFWIMLSWTKYDALDYAIGVMQGKRERERAANRL